MNHKSIFVVSLILSLASVGLAEWLVVATCFQNNQFPEIHMLNGNCAPAVGYDKYRVINETLDNGVRTAVTYLCYDNACKGCEMDEKFKLNDNNDSKVLCNGVKSSRSIFLTKSSPPNLDDYRFKKFKNWRARYEATSAVKKESDVSEITYWPPGFASCGQFGTEACTTQVCVAKDQIKQNSASSADQPCPDPMQGESLTLQTQWIEDMCEGGVDCFAKEICTDY